MTTTPVGPIQIEAGLAPGGLVIDVYNGAGEFMLRQRVADVEAEIEFHASAAAAFVRERTVPGEETTLVVYDGDTGERWTPADLLLAVIESELDVPVLFPHGALAVARGPYTDVDS